MTNSDSGTKLNPGDRVRPSFAGDIQIAAVALETRWLAAEQAAEEAERQAKVARGEAEEARQEAKDARDELGAIRAERDALRAACEAVTGPAVGVSAQALAAAVKEALAVQLAAVMRTADHRCADARRIAALEDRVAAVRAAWGRCRTWWSPASEDERATMEAVDKALGGVAAKPAERECCWEQTVEQRVSEIEARLGRLESGGARRP